MGTTMGAGFAVTVLGLAIVFCFIALLALAIHLLSRFKGEEVAAVPERSGELVAVIGAALHAHRLSRKSSERRGES
jgi:Na+-transporting methylmalonyl-CoA/oxaloacetate decarboxylase gamma subunit